MFITYFLCGGILLLLLSLYLIVFNVFYAAASFFDVEVAVATVAVVAAAIIAVAAVGVVMLFKSELHKNVFVLVAKLLSLMY